MRQRSRQAVKLDDVAKRVGVSPSTVSLYVRRPEKVSPATGSKIQRAIDDLGYVHNKIASQFTGGRSNNMAVVVPSVANITFSNAIQQIEKVVSEQGFQLTIASHDHNLDKEEAQIRSLLEWKPAAIAIAGAVHNPGTLRMLQNSGIPVVQMWQVEGEDFQAQVGINHVEAGYQSARYLLDSGCKKLAYFTTRFEEDVRARKRYEGFSKAVEKAGGTPIVVDVPDGDNLYAEARPLLLQTMVKERGLDGIVVSRDTLGIALLSEAAERGIAVPEKLSVLGFGDFPMSGHLYPVSLSSLNIHDSVIARSTGEMMLRMTDDPEYKGEVVDVGFDIIPRGSTRFPV